MSDYTRRNIEHFDKRATSYDTSPFKIDLARKCSNAFLETEGVKWDLDSSVVVDFACGTGLISQNIASHARTVVGLDTSQAMVDVYNTKATNNGLSTKMHALCIDILSLPEPALPQEIQGVDIVVCSMSYHHIENIDHASKVLASLLKKGGYMLIVDLLQNDVSTKFHNHGHPKHVHGHGHSHGHEHHHRDPEHLDGHTPQSIVDTVPHIGGLSKERLEEAFTSTGLLEDVVAKEAFREVKEGTEFTFVIASGKRK